MTQAYNFERGKKFGKLTIIIRTNRKRHSNILWKCKCDCGNIVYLPARGLAIGDNKSCGCMRLKTGLSKTHLYKIWRGIIDRTINKKSKDYPNWGDVELNYIKKGRLIFTFSQIMLGIYRIAQIILMNRLVNIN